jgi:hypothetical protein
MGRKLSAFETELYQRTDEVLHYIWDPIEISAEPSARDQYHAYLPQVFGMLIAEPDKQTIVTYLLDVQANRMGLSPDVERAEETADTLLSWRAKLKNEHLL